VQDIAEKLQDLSVEWQELGKAHYRMYKMCDLQWSTFIIGTEKYNAEFEINGSIVASARNGGPIAVMNRKDNFLSGASHLLKDHIGIFNACGKLTGKVMWKEKGDVVCFEYTVDEVLVVVTSDCRIQMMRPKEEEIVICKDVGAQLQNNMIEGAKVHENSLFLITSKNQVFFIEDLNECKLELICDSYKG